MMGLRGGGGEKAYSLEDLPPPVLEPHSASLAPSSSQDSFSCSRLLERKTQMEHGKKISSIITGYKKSIEAV